MNKKGMIGKLKSKKEQDEETEVVMATKNRTTEIVSHRYCTHANAEVTITTDLVYPAEMMPLQAPRLRARRCSHFFDCNLQDKTACTFSVDKPQTTLAVD
jgi:hypothetical protein